MLSAWNQALSKVAVLASQRSEALISLHGEKVDIMNFSKWLWVAALVSAALFAMLAGPDVCQAVSGNPRVKALVENADAYSKQGNHLLAMSMYDQAIRISPGDMGLYYKRASIFGAAGQYGSAIKDLNRVIGQGRMGKDRYPAAIRFRADCFMALGQMQKASEDYMAFLRKAPKDGKVWSYLVEAYALMGRTDLALQAVNKGLATGSHWSGKLKSLQMQILTGETITPHKPFSN